jgi:hypothetical protein
MNRVFNLNQIFRATTLQFYFSLLLAMMVGYSVQAQTLTVDLGPDQTICRGASVDITATVLGGVPPYVYEWSNGASTQTIRVTPVNTTMYSVTVSDNGGGTGSVSVVSSITISVETPFQMACNDHIQVSLDEACSAVLEPDMLLEGPVASGGGYDIKVFTEKNQTPHANLFNAADIGKTFQFQIFNPCGNSCWGRVTIEDKLPPEMFCRHDSLRCNDPLGPYERGFPFPMGATIAEELGDKSFRVINWDACTDVTLYYEDSTAHFQCDAEFTKVMYRKWYAQDSSGNLAICYDTFSIYRPDIELDVNFPPSYDGHDLLPINCADINGYPTPDITGRPVMASCKTIQATYTDTRINVCGATYKILRKWTILDWCTTAILEEYQIIKVLDEDPPIVVCPPNFTISTDVYTCTGSTYAPPPTVLFECSDWDYEVFYKLADATGQPNARGAIPAVRHPNGLYFLPDLPLGRTWIIYRITDACGNYTECASEVDVEDEIPPIPVCDEHTVVSLTLDGTGKIFAKTFSDKSYDNCGIDSIDVRRMEESCETHTDEYGPFVLFCCEDIGDTHLVEFRVRDFSGNTNTCMVEVRVQDKIPPTIVCPPNITVSCRFEFDLEDLSVFGTVVDDVNDREEIIVDPDYYPPNGLAGLDGYAIDACGVVITESEVIDIECGQGTIRRIFRAEDPFGNRTSCTQTIFVEDPQPFNRRDITFPRDVTINGCLNLDTKPSRTGFPTYRNRNCAQVAASFHDLVLTVVDSACYKIIRSWTVLDWCQYDQSQQAGIWRYDQIIKVQNNQAPVLENCEDITFCDDSAAEINGVCYGHAELIQQATDDCTPVDKLQWRYRIDIDNNGSWDSIGFTNDARDVYPLGTHKIEWTVTDQCGNESKCSYLFTVEDCKPPTPYCLHGITTVVMPSVGCITVWAVDFDAGSFDNCTAQEDLRFSFSEDSTETARTWCCDSLFSGNILTRNVRIYVWDEFGNRDYCETYIVIRDNDEVCVDSVSYPIVISGELINRADNGGLSNARVMAKDANVGLHMSETMSGNNGSFMLEKLPMYMNYAVVPEKNDDLLNGVSVADIIRIQRHILGIAEFDNPYDLLAADVNRTSTVSVRDLIDIRKAILGLSNEFPNNKSWRFLPEGYTFPDPANPWNATGEIVLNKVDKDQWSKDFMAIKVGDVNGNARSNVTGGLQTRSNGTPVVLETELRSFDRGDRLEIPVYATETEDLTGLQLTLVVDAEYLTLEQLIPGDLPFTAEHLGLTWKEDGVITMAWNDYEGVRFESGDVLFTIVAYGKKASRTEGRVHISSSITQALAVDQTLEDRPLTLRMRGSNSDVTAGYFLHQNRPNPFQNRTAITFDLPEATSVQLTVFDVTGKVLYRINRDNLLAGNHTEWIDGEMLPGAGIYYYQLDADGYTGTRKMILVE